MDVDKSLKMTMNEVVEAHQEMQKMFAPFIFYVTPEEIHRVIYRCCLAFESNKTGIYYQNKFAKKSVRTFDSTMLD